MFIPLWVIVGVVSFVAGMGAMFGLGLAMNKREQQRVAKLLRDTLPASDDADLEACCETSST